MKQQQRREEGDRGKPRDMLDLHSIYKPEYSAQ